MIKIVETYSDKIRADVEMQTIAWATTTDANGVVVSAYAPETIPVFQVQTRLYKSEKDRDAAILKAKLDIVKLDTDTVLLIIKHEKKNVAILTRPISGNNVQLHSVKINGIPFYQYIKNTEIDKKMLGKMNLIYDTISKIDKEGFEALSLTINGIIKSYANTGVVSKKDLVWLNKIYNTYKQLGDLYA